MIKMLTLFGWWLVFASLRLIDSMQTQTIGRPHCAGGPKYYQ